MRKFKIKHFHKWAEKEGISDAALIEAVSEMEQGLIDANLGGNVYKKRVALPCKGKSGGVRTLLAFKNEDRAVFMYGFAKNKRANISVAEFKALKLLAAEFLSYSDQRIQQAINADELIEVIEDE